MEIPVTTMPEKQSPGRPTKLTDEVERRIVAAARAHQRIEVAAELAGVGRETLYGWLRTAGRVNQEVAGGRKKADLTPQERRCVRFSDEVVQALAVAEEQSVQNIIAAGSQSAVETKRARRCVGLVEGQPVYAEEEVTIERPSDWRAHSWWLEHGPTLRGAYASKQRVEMTGPDGGPIEVEFAARLEALATKIKNHQAAIRANSEEATR